MISLKRGRSVYPAGIEQENRRLVCILKTEDSVLTAVGRQTLQTEDSHRGQDAGSQGGSQDSRLVRKLATGERVRPGECRGFHHHHTHTRSHMHTHMLSNTHTCRLSCTHSRKHTLTHMLTLTHTHAHALTCTYAHLLTPTHTLSHMHTRSIVSRACTLTHTHIHSHMHTHTMCIVSHTCTLTHTDSWGW